MTNTPPYELGVSRSNYGCPFRQPYNPHHEPIQAQAFSRGYRIGRNADYINKPTVNGGKPDWTPYRRDNNERSSIED